MKVKYDLPRRFLRAPWRLRPEKLSRPPVSTDKKAQDDGADLGLEKERKIGRKALAEIEKNWPLEADPARLARLRMILNRLEPHMERRIPYEIHIVKTEALNAFCLPGGFIFFTSGILDLLKTDSEIAAVIAHKMVHADRSHGLKMAAKSQAVSLAALSGIYRSRR